MGTYEKLYSIKWLNMNPEQKKIEALYSVNVNLDDGSSIELTDYRISIQGEKYYELFNIEITVMGRDSTLGEFLSYLTASAAKIQDEAFPVSQQEIDKFGTTGIDLLNDQNKRDE
jgi:hypothetical protein